jgi:hypothetical protein
VKKRLFLSLTDDLAYTEIPKCGCSTVKQYLYRVGNGAFHPGSIHRTDHGLLSWRRNSLAVRWRLMRRRHHHFTFVRNPYARVLSAFFDKIANPQEGGEMYGKPALRAAVADFGIDPAADPVAAFRRFLLFVRDNIRYREPVDPDIHWTPMARHAAAPLDLGFVYDEVFHMESFDADLGGMLRRRLPERAAEWSEIRAFNEGVTTGLKRTMPIADYFDATARMLMEEAFAEDFDCFGYSRDPSVAVASPPPIDEINARLQKVRAARR